MANLGGEIAHGAAIALWAMASSVPLAVWLILGVAVVVAIAVLRVATNWKVDVFGIVVVALISLVVYYRQHWIDIGYNQALARVKAAEAQVATYKKTNGLIETCYAQSTSATYLWDRTKGQCLRADGAQ
jgi:hypothetical protein